jgi:hypothetical protein
MAHPITCAAAGGGDEQNSKTTTMKRSLFSLCSLVLIMLAGQAQTEEAAVRATATDYIEGTARGDIPRIRRAFTKTAALYAVETDGSLKRIPIETYIGYFKPNQATGRVGKIVSVDVVNDAASVKIEILSRGWKFTDYLLLLKLDEGWKIINKSYTRVKAE